MRKWDEEDIQFWRNSAKRWRRYQFLGGAIVGGVLALMVVTMLGAAPLWVRIMTFIVQGVAAAFAAGQVKECMYYERRSAKRADMMAEGRGFEEVFDAAA